MMEKISGFCAEWANRLKCPTTPPSAPSGRLALGRKNYLFAGSDTGGRRAAILYTLIETARLNDTDPQAWLADVIARIADHPINRIDELLPWTWKPHAQRAAPSQAA